MRVVLADDSVLLREGLCRVLADAGFEVVAQVGDANALHTAVELERPDVAIVDVRMPPTHTDEGARAASGCGRAPRTRGPAPLAGRRGAARAPPVPGVSPQAFGYLLKDRVLEIDDFLDAVRRVGRGGTAVDPEVVARLMGRRATTARCDG